MVLDFFSMMGVMMGVLTFGSILWVMNCKKCFGDN